MDIQMGIWIDRVNRIHKLLKAGANSISKFPALKKFNSEAAIEIEKQCKKAGFKFKGSLTEMPKVDWDKEVDKLDLKNDLKDKIKLKLKPYLTKMNS